MEQTANGFEVAIDQVEANPGQPRKTFDSEDLEGLASSVRMHGILQPIVVRPAGDRFQIIAGERRFRAAREAGLSTVPVRVLNFNDQQVLEAALIENIHRSDLNPIEKAQGFKEHLDRFGLSHEQLAERLGLARSTITNLVHLLDLAPDVQDGLRFNQITEGHAKVLKGIKEHDQQVAIFRQIVAMGLSVKGVEQLIREQRDGSDDSSPQSSGSGGGGGGGESPRTAHVENLENELRQRLATPVEIRLRAKDKGQITINFETNDDFMRIMEALRK